MPLQPVFHPFRPFIEERFALAKADGGLGVAATELNIEEEPIGRGKGRAEFVVFDPTGPVRITWNAVASLWALAQGAGRLSRRMFDGSRKGLDRLPVQDDPELERGLNSFELARRFCMQHPPPEAASPHHWPDWAPPINPVALPDTDDNTGNRLFLGAIGWIFRHELAHLALRHDDRQTAEGLSNPECETEADREATGWVQAGLRADSNRAAGARPGDEELQLEWRAISLGMGLIWVALFEADRGVPSEDHPPIAVRLFACLDQLGLREDSMAAEILYGVIHAWIAPEADWAPPGGHLTARAALDEAIFQLHRHMP